METRQNKNPAVAESLNEEPKKLSPRQLDCLYLTASGKCSHEIAALLSIKKSTVEGYKKQIFKKMSAFNMCHAIFKAMSSLDIIKQLEQCHINFKEANHEKK